MALKRASRDFGLVVVGLCAIAYLAFGRGGAKAPAPTESKPAVRLAFFPNITHAPALIGVHEGMFTAELRGYRLDTKVVNAGPEAMEALLAGQIDFAYVGPSPALNTYTKTQGKALRIIAGACDGGASLIRRSGVQIQSVKDLDGKRVAVPQLGGTQDVSCRKFIAAQGLRSKERGGTVQIIPVKNPDILALFKQKQIDAAWVPEPWAARIKAEIHAETVVDERDLWPGRRFTTTVLVVRKAYADKHPDVVEAMLRAHGKSIALIQQNPTKAKGIANEELKLLTGKALPAAVLDEAWARVAFSAEPDRASIRGFAQAAVEAGYLKSVPPDLDGIFASEKH